jgi:cytochrome c-type biogenesis protein CcmH
MTTRHLLTLVVVASVAGSAWAAGADVERQARRIEGLLMAPCCGANTLADHDSGAAHAMKREIREMLARGHSEREILDHYVAEHGHTILAMPPASGFSLLAYAVPTMALVVGPWLLWRRLRGRRASDPDAPFPAMSVESRERLERELRQF